MCWNDKLTVCGQYQEDQYTLKMRAPVIASRAKRILDRCQVAGKVKGYFQEKKVRHKTSLQSTAGPSSLYLIIRTSMDLTLTLYKHLNNDSGKSVERVQNWVEVGQSKKGKCVGPGYEGA